MPALALLAALALPRQARAQEGAPAAEDGPVCLGFAFGPWKPKLDWKGVGHAAIPAGAPRDSAPGNRDWAAPPGGVGADSALLLVPRWWPAGVSVALPTRAPAVGDTVVGRAVALVPRGDVEAPATWVRAWRVPCRGSAGR